jgi:hypothetical protein
MLRLRSRAAQASSHLRRTGTSGIFEKEKTPALGAGVSLAAPTKPPLRKPISNLNHNCNVNPWQPLPFPSATDEQPVQMRSMARFVTSFPLGSV